MLRYISADLKRIARRIPRIIWILGFIAIMIGAIIIVQFLSNQQYEGQPLLKDAPMGEFIAQLIPTFCMGFGLVELFAVFSEDFKAKTMQVAIGVGTPRRRIVLSKLIEVIILTVSDMAITFLALFITQSIMGIGMTGSQLAIMAANCGYCILRIVSIMNITMIVIFMTQGTGLSTLAYVLIDMSMLGGFIQMLYGIEFIAKLDPCKYLLSTNLGAIGQMVYGEAGFEIFPVIIVAAYFVGGLLLNIILFNKKELEF